MIDLKDMKIFAAVAQYGGFTAAGRNLDIPKQTISRRVAALEAALGVQLLNRTTRKLFLTPVGEAYATRCHQMVRAADEANQFARNATNAPRGLLRLTADQVVGELFLAPLVITYLRQFPEVSVSVNITSDKMDDATFDIATRVGLCKSAEKSKSLMVRRLGPAKIRYVAAPSYLAARGTPTSPEQLITHDCVGHGSGSASSAWPFRSGENHDMVRVHTRVATNNIHVAYQSVIAGLGIGIFPEFACERDLGLGKLLPVLDDFRPFPGDIFLAWPANAHLPVKVRAFIDLATTAYDSLAPWNTPTAWHEAVRS